MSRRRRHAALEGLPLPEPGAAPGSTLAWRLEVRRTRWSIGAVVVLLLFLVPLLMLAVLLAAVTLVGLLIPHFRRKIVGRFRAARSPVRVELDRHPLVPGEAFAGTVLFKRPRPLERLVVALVCDEEVRYRQGTDTRTEEHRVHDEVLLERGAAMDDGGVPGPAGAVAVPRVDFEAALPADAMHSFEAQHNELRWAIEVRRTFPGTSEVKEPVAMQVYPFAVAERLVAEMAGGAPSAGAAR